MTSSDAAEDREDGRIDAAPSDDSEGELADVVVTPPAGEDAKPAASLWPNRVGLAVSLLLHGLALYALFYAFHTVLPPLRLTVLPVELVIGEETTAPQPIRQAAAPQRRSAAPQPPSPRATPQPAQQLASVAPPPVVVPLPPPERPRDAMQDRLEALSRLQQPQNGNSAVTANGDGTRRGPQSYSVRDYVRAQVEQRWSPDVGSLRNRNIVVSIHVVLEPDGTVASVEIVDRQRFQSDSAYYLLALSARNAVWLSSPIALPAGSGVEDLDMVLNLNPANLIR